MSEDFPIEWQDPADAGQTWRYDPVHMPNALAPLEFELGMQRFLEGFGWGMRPKQFNYCTFFTVSGERAGGRAPPAQPTVQDVREGGPRWREEVLPEVIARRGQDGHVDFRGRRSDRRLRFGVAR